VRVHLDVLGWLHGLTGWVALACGAALLLLAGGTASLTSDGAEAMAVVWMLLAGGLAMSLGGWLMIVTGRAITRRRKGGRLAALLLAVPALFIPPFGTALAAYSLWALLNDDARAAFGRPPRRRRVPTGESTS
jgi:threonine/homoserine efflux transporter RhtA